ncbi:cupin domain-containing protein [Cytophagaceae bacterium ABcell3]|nr:cupin domain-containing protein [Cytophagaceae bacterium ABcell3]
MDKLISDLKTELAYADDRPASILLKHNSSKVLLLAIKAGQELQPHTNHEDTILTITEGDGALVMNGSEHFLKTGAVVRIPAGVMHALHALSDIKFILIR